MMILVVLIPRLVKVDYHLPAIEMKIPQIWDWSDDTSPHRHAEHPYSSNNLEYDGVVVFVKLLLLLMLSEPKYKIIIIPMPPAAAFVIVCIFCFFLTPPSIDSLISLFFLEEGFLEEKSWDFGKCNTHVIF